MARLMFRSEPVQAGVEGTLTAELWQVAPGVWRVSQRLASNAGRTQSLLNTRTFYSIGEAWEHYESVKPADLDPLTTTIVRLLRRARWRVLPRIASRNPS